MFKKRLTRSNTNRVIFGVFGGLAAYLHWNSLYLRIFYILLTLGLEFLSFRLVWLMIAIYIIAALLMPKAPSHRFSWWDLLRSWDSNSRNFKSKDSNSSSSGQGRKIIHHVKVHDIKK